MPRPIRTLLAGALAAATCVATAAAPAAADTRPQHTAAPTTTRAIPGQYLVTLDLGSDIEAVLDEFDIRPMFVYRSVTLGFAARLTEYQAQFLRYFPQVKAVEADREIRLDPSPSKSGAAQRAVASWGLDRIDQRDLPLDGTYSPAHDGAQVTAYVLDTGIQHNHPEFGGRATFGYDAMNDGRQGEDCNGHGTHVAGTVGSSTYGVAKQVKLVSVRVLGCDGRGSYSGIIAGLDWVGANARKPAVLNASLGGTPGSSQVDNAANALTDKGVFMAVSAGNDATNACNYSPARASKVMTVGATTRDDGYASYSNRGECVEILAPGSEIVSTWTGSGTRSLSGTSMASPHVAGVAALYKHANGDRSQGEIMNWMRQNGTSSRIGQVPANTPNTLLNIDWL